MGLFEKLGLVEEIPQETDFIFEAGMKVEEILPEVELESVNTSTLIDDIYASNKLEDLTRSIFKVEELINSLPKEMVTETKKTTVLAILGSFGLTTSEVIEDGTMREDVLNAVKNQITDEYTDSITNEESQIEEHKKAIAELEAAITKEKEELKLSNEMIATEIERINKLINFVGGN